MSQRSVLSAFNGKIDEIPGVYVDNFEHVEYSRPRVYFLSHCHSDHIQGLHSSDLLNYLEKNNVFIYTTQLSAAIIDHEKKDARVTDYVKVLKLGSTLVTLPASDDRPEVFLTVTLIPAGHCAGSVMFLFQTEHHTVLFTGDFRVNPSDIPKYAAFHTDGVPIPIDAMYLDTTFIDSTYENFPKRSESVQELLVELQKWLPKGGVAIHTSAKYGYEFLFNEIYLKLGKKVYVDEDRWRFYRSISHLVPGVTNNKMATQIHLCTKRKEDNHTTCIPNNYPQFLYVHLSAMKWTHYEHTLKSVDRVSSTRVDVCFATHCSRSELMAFVKYFAPKRIVGFPNPYKSGERRGVKRKIEDSGDKKLDPQLLKELLG